ncbi:MAG: hypothetical protein RL685_6057 [Pseudomonadota bacterium]|jgi:hypothetical protein
MAGSATEVLAAMITPALLISASGTLVLSTSNRLSRVVDRVRVLARDAEQLQATPSAAPDDARQAQAKRSLIIRQVASLAARALILRSALAAFYLAIGLLVATSIVVGVLTWLSWLMTWLVIALALLGACALLWGSVLLVREGRQAISSTFDEMQYIRNLVQASAGASSGAVD